MSLPDFLTSLLNDGRARVDPIYDPENHLVSDAPGEIDSAFDLLSQFETEYRSDLPGQPPPLSQPSALWAATSVYRACSLLAYRAYDAEQVELALNVPCPESPSPQTVYAVDLTFRFLPDLVRLARAASPDDRLVHVLMRWAQQWPLSSVGISGVTIELTPAWLADSCLRQMYVDRILLMQDESRLTDPQTREGVIESLGKHPELSPKLANLLLVK
ncbi:MAG: hypothetical protein WCJ09_09250 [Planctomycetota bacterium]